MQINIHFFSASFVVLLDFIGIYNQLLYLESIYFIISINHKYIHVIFIKNGWVNDTCILYNGTYLEYI